MSPRRRAAVLAGLALLLGGLAASDVSRREAALRRAIGPTVPVLVAARDLAPGTRLTARTLALRPVPARWAPVGAYASPVPALGARLAAGLPRGAAITAAALDAGEAPGAPVRPGERVAQVVAVAPADLVRAGSRADVLVTSERPGGGGEARLALEDVEVLAAQPVAGDDPAAAPRVRAALRVTLRQAVYLAAAESFARELRLLPRASTDRRRSRQALAFDRSLSAR